MSRRFAGAGLLRRAARSPSANARDVDPLTDIAGLQYWWEASVETVTLNGSNVSAVEERVAGSADATQGTAGNQPAWNASGGPNDLPYIHMQDTARMLSATVSIAAGNRWGLIAVVRASSNSATRAQCRLVDGSNVPAMFYNDGSTFLARADFTGGGQIIAPGNKDVNWHVRAILPRATGAVYQRDGADGSPNFTGTDTLRAATAFNIGHPSVAGGAWASAMVLSDISVANVAIAYRYYRQRYALG